MEHEDSRRNIGPFAHYGNGGGKCSDRRTQDKHRLVGNKPAPEFLQGSSFDATHGEATRAFITSYRLGEKRNSMKAVLLQSAAGVVRLLAFGKVPQKRAHLRSRFS